MSLTVHDLTVEIGGQIVVDGFDLQLADGSRHGLIGESGSGKSMTTLAILGLLPAGARLRGSITLDGRELTTLPERDRARTRGSDLAVVFQDPRTALNPIRKIGAQIAEAARIHHRISRAAARSRAVELAALVRLPEPDRVVELYPHQLSGGQRQRVAIAIALADHPRIVIADEPTTALDVTTQAEILSLLNELVDRERMSLLFVTHDLAVLTQIVQEVTVLDHGRIVERASVRQILDRPQEPVTRQLVAAARATAWTPS